MNRPLLAGFELTAGPDAKLLAGKPELIGPRWMALSHKLPCGGRCPKGRKAEDGPIDAKYSLTESSSASYLQRTEWNARDSEATVLFSLAPELTGGSKKTVEFAKKHHKPWIHLAAGDPRRRSEAQRWLAQNPVEVLNVAGPPSAKQRLKQISGDLSSLASLTALRSLNLAYFGQLRGDLSPPLAGLTSLQSLNLAACDQLSGDLRKAFHKKKNWLFFGDADAGERSAIIYSIIESFRRHGIEPYTLSARRTDTPAIHDQSSD